MSFPSHPAGITTLHRLGPDSWPELEASLGQLSRQCPLTLILPCHVRELGTDALSAMLQELAQAPWLQRLVIGLDAAEAKDVREIQRLLTPLPQETLVVWADSPEVRAVERRLEKQGFTIAESGKGRNVWLCAGVALAAHAGPGVVGIHDCDILQYSRELAGRLFYPLLDPQWGFRYNKGFYSRHSDRLHGRLQRLMVRPLLRAMELRAGPVGMLQFLSAFRYPLAGESALDLSLLRQLDIPSTWGLEIGMLEEIGRHLAPRWICQTELSAAYDHKHQELHPDDPSMGLHRMAREVASTLLATVSGGTYPWREEIVATWENLVTGALREGEAESILNGLYYSPEEEKLAVHTFGKALLAAVEEPAPPALLPSWEGAEHSVPGISQQLLAAAYHGR